MEIRPGADLEQPGKEVWVIKMERVENGRGFFVAFEGGEGGGKTSQIGLIGEWFNDNDQPTKTFREPGTGRVSEAIRSLLIGEKMADQTEALLFLAARSEFVSRHLRPTLEAGVNVVNDRFATSTYVYQGLARGLSVEDLVYINRFAVGNLKPDHNILLDLPPEVGLARVRGESDLDVIESLGLGFHRKVNGGYLDIAKGDPDNWTIIDATKSFEEVTKAIKGTFVDLGYYVQK